MLEIARFSCEYLAIKASDCYTGFLLPPSHAHAQLPGAQIRPKMQMDYGVLPQAGGEPTYSSSNMAPFLTKLFQIVSAGSTERRRCSPRVVSGTSGMPF